MANKTDQLRSALAITKASLIAQLRSPTSLVFAILFPIVFIIVFGAMVDNSAVRINIGVDPATDTTSLVGKAILSAAILHPQYFKDPEEMQAALKKGRIAGILHVSRESMPVSLSAGSHSVAQQDSAPMHDGVLPHYKVRLTLSHSTADKWPLLRSVIKESIDRLNEAASPPVPAVAEMTISTLPARYLALLLW